MTEYEKKEVLYSYLFQEKKIKRLKELVENNKDASYLDELNSAIDLRNKIEERIKYVNDPILVEILFQKYVFGKTLEEISYIINYSHRHTERLHRKAIKKFEF